jgi:hypothetical protein
VPDIWHSGKPEALGEFPFSRSAKKIARNRNLKENGGENKGSIGGLK